jgi:hypothetical protein
MRVLMTNATVSFAHQLYEATSFKGGEPKFGSDFLENAETEVFELRPVEGGGVQRVKTTMARAMLDTAEAAWPGKGKAMLMALEQSKKCYRNGDKKVTADGDPYEDYAGCYYVTAKNKTQPTLLDAAKNKIQDDNGTIYSGCRVNVSFDLYANTKAETKGVFASLKGVQYVAPGDSFGGGGGKSNGDEFENLSDQGDDASSLF